MTQKTAQLLESIGKAMSGDMFFRLPFGLYEQIAATELNTGAVGTVKRQFMVSLEYARGIHLWASLNPVLEPEEFANDSSIGPPSVVALAGAFEAGLCALECTFDTDAGATKQYQDGDAIFVSAHAQTGDTLLGWPLPKAVQAFFVTTTPVPSLLRTSELLELTGMTLAQVLLGPGAAQQSVKVLGVSIDFPVGATAATVELGRLEGNGSNLFVPGVAGLTSPYDYVVLQFENGNGAVYNKSSLFQPLSLQYQSPTGAQSLTIQHTTAIGVQLSSSRSFFVTTDGHLYPVQDTATPSTVSLCKAMQNPPL